MSMQTSSQHGRDASSTPFMSSRPVHFIAGPLAGRTIRVELIELQKADVGRKSSSDRRPLDPPPIVHLRLFDIREAHSASSQGDYHEQELVNLSEADSSGFVCHADLFLMPRTDDNSSQSTPSASTQPSRQPFQPNPLLYSGEAQVASTYLINNIRPGAQDHEDAHTVVAHMNGVAVTMGSLCTHLVSGPAVTTSSVVTYNNAKQVMFIFSDIAVKDEGQFFLRYRVFNTLFQVAGPKPLPVLAECIGGPFTVYSTKNFPGLRASTSLTKLVSQGGVRVTSREHERKRRKSTRGTEASSSAATGRRDLRPIVPQTGTGTGAGASVYPAEYQSGQRNKSEERGSGRRARGKTF